MNENATPVHEEMFKTLLRTPHRNVDEILDIHRKQFESDPNFYGKLGVYAAHLNNNPVRDINEVFIAVLFDSPYQPHRDAAYVMFQNLPPYQAYRVLTYFTGYSEIKKIRSWCDEVPEQGKFGITYEPARKGSYNTIGKHNQKVGDGEVIQRKIIVVNEKSFIAKKMKQKGSKEAYVDTLLVHHACLNNKHAKGTLRKAINSYLAIRENNFEQMEGALIRGKKYVRGLYARSQRKEPGWIADYFNNGKAPSGSRLESLKILAKEADPVKQAEIIIANKIPYPIAMPLLRSITSASLIAIINSMSHQEILQNLNVLKKRGAFDNADIKSLIETKLQEIGVSGKNSRVDAMKGYKSVEASKVDADIKNIVINAADKKMNQVASITMRTAILIDKSASMDSAIDLGKKIASSVAQCCKKGKEPVVYLFDNNPTRIDWSLQDGDMRAKSSWDKKLEMFRASGGTQPANAIKALIRNETIVDQIVVITDEQETAVGTNFATEYNNYCAKFGFKPRVVFLRVGLRLSRMTNDLLRNGIEVDHFDCSKVDDVSMVNILTILARKSIFDLLQDILELPLPNRVDWDAKNLLITNAS